MIPASGYKAQLVSLSRDRIKQFLGLLQWSVCLLLSISTIKLTKEAQMFGTAIRFLAKKPKPKMKPIELTTPPEQTQTITRTIFDVVKEHGPLTIADTWEHLKVSFLFSPLSCPFLHLLSLTLIVIPFRRIFLHQWKNINPEPFQVS